VKTATRVAVLAAAAAVLVAGCSTPPGPEPVTPAPSLPEDAIAYDDLKSTDRPFPFRNSCEQINRETLAAVGGGGLRDLPALIGPPGCSVLVQSDVLDELWIEEQPPPNPSEPRYFPLVWNNNASFSNYHRRLVLDGRYYAVETISFRGAQPGCYLTVDTGSPSALQFRGILPEAYAASYGQLDYTQTNYEVDRAGIDRFMAENCPLVEQMAVGLLAAIDPGGGSLATA
jgi:hypothetical protein